MPNSYKRNACQNKQRISQAAVKALVSQDDKVQKLLENEDNWSVFSFDPEKKEVCVMLYHEQSQVLITLSLQTASFNN